MVNVIQYYCLSSFKTVIGTVECTIGPNTHLTLMYWFACLLSHYCHQILILSSIKWNRDMFFCIPATINSWPFDTLTGLCEKSAFAFLQFVFLQILDK